MGNWPGKISAAVVSGLMCDGRPLSGLKGGLDTVMGVAYFASDAHDVARRFSPGGWTHNSGR